MDPCNLERVVEQTVQPQRVVDQNEEMGAD
jgi:hypothetical protein